MTKKLRSCLSKNLFLLFIFLLGFSAQAIYAQTILSPGDLVVVTVNSDDPKSFDFIPLVDLEEGTVIDFTDDAWIDSTASFRGGEGVLTYTAPNPVSAGTVISYSGSDENGYVETDKDFTPSPSGDNILVYQGDKSDPNFIYGIGWAKGNVWEYTGDSTNESNIPPGLSEEANTILSLGTAFSLQYSPENGTEGTQNSLLRLVGDENNWIENSDKAFPVFSSSFTLVDAPTVAFKTDFITVNEGDGTAAINVKLTESNNTAVDVDLTFVASSSSISGSDIGNYSTQTIQFSQTDTSGSTQPVYITLNDDKQYKGNKIAVFQLQNHSNGTIIAPKILKLKVNDDDAPDVVINEVLADPGEKTDANGDGASNDEDEFVEIVNNQSANVDISGWTFANDEGEDTPGTQYTFPQGIVIPANGALVLLGGSSPKGYFGGAIVHTIEGGITFNDSDETLFLHNDSGNIIDKISYTDTPSGESLVRNSDSTLAAHSEFPNSGGSLISAGTETDGTSFGGGYSTGIHGGEGWRMISSPTKNTSFSDILDPFWIQGIQGSDAPGDNVPDNILKWSEALGGFVEPAGMAEEMEAGKGYIVYFFEDDNPSASTPGVPKVLSSNEVENNSLVSVGVSITDKDGDGVLSNGEGWNLLGNPFATDISVKKVKDALSTVGDSLNSNIYVWNHTLGGGNGGYELLNNEDNISPYQAFFVKYMGSTEVENASVDFNRDEMAANKGIHFYKEISDRGFGFDIQLQGEQYFDTYYLEFGEQGRVELDQFDAHKRLSFNRNSISLFSRTGSDSLQKNELPIDLETTLEIPLLLNAPGRKSLTFSWNNIDKVPSGWEIMLIDKVTSEKVNLRVAEVYQFDNIQLDSKPSTHSEDRSLLNKAKTKKGDPRFILSIRPPSQSLLNQGNIPESVKLNPNYPNPFNPSTTISYELAEESSVSLSIWNMIGQKVAILVDDVVEAGTHHETWRASSMPSGMYIARLEVAGQVFIRKMTLIK